MPIPCLACNVHAAAARGMWMSVVVPPTSLAQAASAALRSPSVGIPVAHTTRPSPSEHTVAAIIPRRSQARFTRKVYPSAVTVPRCRTRGAEPHIRWPRPHIRPTMLTARVIPPIINPIIFIELPIVTSTPIASLRGWALLGGRWAQVYVQAELAASVSCVASAGPTMHPRLSPRRQLARQRPRRTARLRMWLSNGSIAISSTRHDVNGVGEECRSVNV